MSVTRDIDDGDLEGIRRFVRFGQPNSEALYTIESIGATLLGVKPASLINTRYSDCLKLCHSHFVCGGSVVFAAVREAGDKKQIFIYHKECLENVLTDAQTRQCLTRMGYQKQGTADQYVRLLIQRMRSADFPHEAGLFFGYPLKDVCGYMGGPIPYRKTMGWRMYGDTSFSEMIYYRYKEARSLVRTILQPH